MDWRIKMGNDLEMMRAKKAQHQYHQAYGYKLANWFQKIRRLTKMSDLENKYGENKYGEDYLRKLAEARKHQLAEAFKACSELEQIQQEYQEIYEALDPETMKDEDAASAEDLLDYIFRDTVYAIGETQGIAVPLNNQMTKWLIP
ncbi:hypothetical protein LCGC14_2225980 [marine sediment metagenome]|uniref:Uncharacterized protein n=1 Tax=marine sediment metagenome TaxID=412755 RepID=A0A0F9D9R2_9ZZZZ